MSAESTSFFDAAFNLPDAERANLAYLLLQSLDPPGVLGEDDAQFADQLQQRLSNFQDSGVAADWDEVALRLEVKLRERRPS